MSVAEAMFESRSDEHRGSRKSDQAPCIDTLSFRFFQGSAVVGVPLRIARCGGWSSMIRFRGDL
jgi:hypothetical protein